MQVKWYRYRLSSLVAGGQAVIPFAGQTFTREWSRPQPRLDISEAGELIEEEEVPSSPVAEVLPSPEPTPEAPAPMAMKILLKEDTPAVVSDDLPTQ